MIAKPVVADALAVVVEELSLVESSFGTGRTPFDSFKAKLKTKEMNHFNESSATRISSFAGRCL